MKQYARTEFREETWKQLAEGFRFVPGDFSDDVAFDNLRRTIEGLDRGRGTDGNHAFYLAFPRRSSGSWPSSSRNTASPTRTATPGGGW